jgi:hypothetical protein
MQAMPNLQVTGTRAMRSGGPSALLSKQSLGVKAAMSRGLYIAASGQERAWLHWTVFIASPKARVPSGVLMGPLYGCDDAQRPT